MPGSTSAATYTKRLMALEGVWWKRLIPVQAPYRYNLKRLNPGFVLDIGCGVGRNLRNLGGRGVGVDHNRESVDVCHQQGFESYTVEEFFKSQYSGKKVFDSLLLSHVLEHMTYEEGKAIVTSYLPFLKSGGHLITICPQQAGYSSDSTHVEYFTRDKLEGLQRELGFSVEKTYSFPFPEFFGSFFRYNEHVVLGRKA